MPQVRSVALKKWSWFHHGPLIMPHHGYTTMNQLWLKILLPGWSPRVFPMTTILGTIFVKPAGPSLCAMARPGATWLLYYEGVGVGVWVVFRFLGLSFIMGEPPIIGVLRTTPYHVHDCFRLDIFGYTCFLKARTHTHTIFQWEWATLRLALPYLWWNFCEAWHFLLKLLCALSRKTA